MPFTLLLVDDSDLVRGLLVRCLESIPGIGRIDTARSFAQTLIHVQTSKPSLVVMDLHLADGNATPHLASLRRHCGNTHIAVLSNDTCDYTRQKCLDSGIDWFFDKSMEFDALLKLVKTLALAPDKAAVATQSLS